MSAVDDAQSRSKWIIIYLVAVLFLSWVYTAFTFLRPERIKQFGLIMLIPGAVALVLNFFRYRSVSRVFSPLTRKIPARSLLFSIFYPLTFIAFCALVATISDLAKIDSSKFTDLLPRIFSIYTLLFLLKLFGEEYGWRGFLLQELTFLKGPKVAAALVGLIWAIWHGPVVYGLATFFHVEHPVRLCLIQMGAVFVFSFPFAHSYLQGGSIIPPMLFHFLWNIYNPAVLGDIYRNDSGLMKGPIWLINGEGLFGVLFGLLFVAWFLRRPRTMGSIQ